MVEGTEITVAEARKLLGYRTDDYVLRLLRAGLIEGRKVGTRWRVKRPSVTAYKARVETKRSSTSHRTRSLEERRAAVLDKYPRRGSGTIS